MENKLKGGLADNKKDFSSKEKQAISQGAKIESKEHGKLAPKEIAADHVAEHGAKYYNNKEGLPALERKLEKKAPQGVDPKKHESCVQQVKQQGKDVGSAHAICTASLKKEESAMTPQEKVAKIKHHNQQAIQAASTGDKVAAVFHHKEAYKHYKSLVGEKVANLVDNKNLEKNDMMGGVMPPPDTMEAKGHGLSGETGKRVTAGFKGAFGKSDASLKNGKTLLEKATTHRTTGSSFLEGGGAPKGNTTPTQGSTAPGWTGSIAGALGFGKSENQADQTRAPDQVLPAKAKWAELLEKAKGCLGKCQQKLQKQAGNPVQPIK